MLKIQNVTVNQQKDSNLLIYIFYIWTFVLISRPQDIIEALAPVRPALSVCVVIIILYLFRSSSYRNSFLDNKQCRLYLYLLAIMIISIPFAYYRRGAFDFFFTKYIVTVVYFYLFYKIINNEKYIKDVIFIACIAACLYLLSAMYKGDISTGRLAFGQMYDPNDLAFLAVSFSPLNILYLSKTDQWWKRLFGLSAIAVGVLAILMTGSRGGFIALCAVIIMLLFTRLQNVKMSNKFIIVVIAGVSVLYGNSVIDYSRYISLTEISQDYNVYDETGRLEVWRKGFELMLSNPLTGVGISCFNEAIGQDRLARGMQEIWQSPHNSLIQIGAETGIIGLILFVVVSVNAFRIFGRSRKNNNMHEIIQMAEIARLSYTGHFVSAMFLSQAYSLSWVYFICLSAVLQRIESEKEIDMKRGHKETA